MAVQKEVIARLKSHGKEFDIIVDSEKVPLYKEGKVGLKDILISDAIFRGLKTMKKIEELPMKPGGGKGGDIERVKAEELMQIFGTTDFMAIAKQIVEKGEVQLTVEQRRELIEKKKKQIVTFISQQAVDPRTKNPHPPQRIELAMEQARVTIDPFKKVEEQVKDIIKALQPLLPLSIEKKRLAFKIPINCASQAKYLISSLGTIIKDEWGASWIVEVEIPAGLVEQLYAKLNALTHGELESRELK